MKLFVKRITGNKKQTLEAEIVTRSTPPSPAPQVKKAKKGKDTSASPAQVVPHPLLTLAPLLVLAVVKFVAKLPPNEGALHDFHFLVLS